MLNAMSSRPRVPVPGRKADVISRYHSPAATPCMTPSGYCANPIIHQSGARDGRASCTRYSTTLTARMVQVTVAAADGRPPNTVRGSRAGEPPWAPGPVPRTHSTHCCPTAASRRQSGQAWRPHRTQETQVSLPGCRKQVGGVSWPPVGLAWSGAVIGAYRRLVALDGDRLQHHVGPRTVARHGLNPADLVDHVGAADNLAEDRVPAVEPRRGCHRDEELGAIGARSGVRHGQQVRLVEAQIGVDLVGELIARAAGAGAERVAALDHEPGDHPVEDRAVVQLVLGPDPGLGVRPLLAALG